MLAREGEDMGKSRKDILLSMGARVGGVLGAIAFLIFGLVPGFYFGSYAALVLLSKLFGGPLQATVLVKGFVAMGVILGMISIAFACIVIGAIFGTMVGYLTVMITERDQQDIKDN